MRSCSRDLHTRMLRGGTGWDEYTDKYTDEYLRCRWYHTPNETWYIITIGIIWVAFLIILAVA